MHESWLKRIVVGFIGIGLYYIFLGGARALGLFVVDLGEDVASVPRKGVEAGVFSILREIWSFLEDLLKAWANASGKAVGQLALVILLAIPGYWVVRRVLGGRGVILSSIGLMVFLLLVTPAIAIIWPDAPLPKL